MRQVIVSGERAAWSDQVLQGGGFRYQLDFNWARWPENLEGTHGLNACFAPDGTMFVATDDKEHPINLFSPSGEYLTSIGQGLFSKAHSVFVTPSGTLLAADSSTEYHVIREITREGRLIRDFGTLGQPGDSGYDFNYLEVLKRENRVPEAPEWNKRPEANARLDSVRRLGEPFCRPCAMVMDQNGEYFAADGYGNDAVHRFAADGSYLFSWGGPGKEPGKFRLVHDIRIDIRGRVWVADRENSRVQIFTRDGELLAMVSGGLMRIGGIWTDQQFAYIGELDGGITILDLDLNVRVQMGKAGSPLHAHGITGDRAGNLYIMTNKKNSNNILRLKRLQ